MAIVDGEAGNAASRTNSATNVRDSAPETSYENGDNGHKIAFDPRDISENAERSKQPKLTMMEEVLLLGLKDKQVRIPSLRSLFASTLNTRLPIRATFPSGTTISRMPSGAASSSSLHSVAASAWKRTPLDVASPRPIAISKL